MKIPPKTGRWLLAVVVAVVVYLFFSGNEGLLNILHSQRMVNASQKEVVKLKATKDSLKTTVKKLKNDTTYIERVAREKLGMAKKNEKVYKFVDE